MEPSLQSSTHDLYNTATKQRLGQDYRVEVSTSLSPWSPVPTGDYDVNTITNEGMTQVELTLPLDYADRAFLKLLQPQE